MIYLLTALGLTAGGSSRVHSYTHTIHRTTQLTTSVWRRSRIRTQSCQTNWEECGPCSVFASFTLAFAIQLRKKHGKTSVRVAEVGSYTHTQHKLNVMQRRIKPESKPIDRHNVRVTSLFIISSRVMILSLGSWRPLSLCLRPFSWKFTSGKTKNRSTYWQILQKLQLCN
jgi:hypothetical protein